MWSSTFIWTEVLEDPRSNKQLHTRIEGARSCADQPIQVMNVAFFLDLVNFPDFSPRTKAYTFIKFVRRELPRPYKDNEFFLMSLLSAILAFDKHSSNMLFGESDISWDDLENVTDGYFDGFAKEDCQIKAASDLVEYLTVDNATSLLVEMLKMKTGDLSDGNTEGKLFRPFYSDGPTKKQLLDMTKRGEMIVIRPVSEPESISTAICKNRTGEFFDGKDTWYTVLKIGFRDSLLEEIKEGDLDVEKFYLDDQKKTAGVLGLIMKAFR